MRWFLAALLASLATSFVIHDKHRNVCTLFPESLQHHGREVDDVPSILRAFDLCGKHGKVIFTKNVFHINSVMNTTDLDHCDVVLRGELRWSTDFDYWKSHVFPVVFQNQSTGWLFGGRDVTFRSEDGGWYNGNGQAWYTQNQNQSNQPGRPISITFYKAENVLVEGLKIIQPQFWAVHVWESRGVTIRDFVSSATTNNEWSTVNTDGFDSWNSDNITIENADITTRDDCIAPKGNTTNLYVRNVTCHNTNGIAIGSVGQYPATPDYVVNVTVEDVKCLDSRDGAYIKTWQGLPGDDAPPDQGGGYGLIKNITFRNFYMDNVELPIQISQCIYTEDDGRYCNTSRMQIEDVTWSGIRGTSKFNIAASLYCSEANPCPNVRFEDIDLRTTNSTLGLPMWNTTIQHEVFQCANIIDQENSGIPCNREAPSNYGQHPSGNIQ